MNRKINNSFNLCIQEYNFYKGFKYCSELFDNFYKKHFNIKDNVNPYTDLIMVFLYNKNLYKDYSWDPIIHSFRIINNKYVFDKNIENIIINKLIELTQKYYRLDSLWNKELVNDIINNYISSFNIKKYNINTIFNDSIIFFKNKMKDVYDYYCIVRNEYIPIIIKTFEIKFIDNIISFTNNDNNINDIINIKIHPTRYQRLLDLYNKHNNNNIFFHNHLYALLRRNRTIFWQYQVFYGNSVPHNVFEYYKTISSDIYECFADPFNCYLDKYYSAFYDVDKAFGSLGSFFDNPPKNGIAIAHPPTEKHFINATINTILSQIKKNKIIYILGLPIWPNYMKIKRQKLIKNYNKIKINKEMILHAANLDVDINVTKKYYYKYELYIIGKHKFNIKLLEDNINKSFIINLV
jgi:hypothetical protein